MKNRYPNPEIAIAEIPVELATEIAEIDEILDKIKSEIDEAWGTR